MVLHRGPGAIGALFTAAAAACTPLAALAKGPDFYVPLTIAIVGAGGQRTFDASGGADGDAAWKFVQQIEVSVAGQSAALPTPGLSAYYEIVFRQGSAAVNRLPWYGTPTAQFFYYPGRGDTPPHVRLHMAGISEPVRDTWLPAAPSLTAMVQRHLEGLQPLRPSGSPLAIASMALGVGLLLILLALAGGLLLRWSGSFRLRAAQQHNSA